MTSHNNMNNNNNNNNITPTNGNNNNNGGGGINGNGIVLEPFVIDLFEDIARNEGFTEYTIVPSSGSKHGDGFMGIMLRVLVKGRRNGQLGEVLSLMLKMPPMGKARRQQFNSAELFDRESYMYGHVLPLFAEFQKEKGFSPTGADGFFAFPKCYAIVCDREKDRYAIIMEDLKEQGYDMFNKFNVINIEHVRFIMEELAKYHAVSFALRDQRPEVFEPLTKMEDVFLEHMVKRNTEMMQGFQDLAFERALKTLNDDEDALKERVINLKKGFIDHMEDCVRLNVAEPYSVINHGDCWNNNMMYLYNGSNIPRKICLIDFQISRFASPVLDLVYFLFTSTVKSLRDEHYQNILNIYYTSLSETIRKLGSNPEKLFSYPVFLSQLKKFGKYGVLIAPMLVQVVTADPTDIPDMDDLAEDMVRNGHRDVKMFITDKTENTYNVRIRDVLRDAHSYGFL